MYHIHRVRCLKELNKLYENKSLWKLYSDCFGVPPYEEKFTEDEVKTIFDEYYSKGILFFCYDQKDLNSVIGFAAAIPLKDEPEVAQIAIKHSFDVDKTWYYADTGVSSKYRRNGIAANLATQIIEATPDGITLLMRTQQHNIASRQCHIKVGYQVIDGMVQDIMHTRIDGSNSMDHRIFLDYIKSSELNSRYCINTA